MTLTRGGGTTTLTGALRDQAELQGALKRVSDLGLVLLETKAVAEAHRFMQQPPTPQRERPAAIVTRVCPGDRAWL